MPTPLTIPLLNPNEPDVLIAVLHVQEGQLVQPGDPVCTLETTKSTYEMQAETTGAIRSLRFRQGETARAGDLLAYISEDPHWEPPAQPSQQGEAPGPAGLASPDQEIPPNLRITAPALALAQTKRVNLSELPVDILVTEAVVKKHLRQAGTQEALASPLDPHAIIIYGGGGHGKMVIDLLRSLGTFRIAGIIDDGRSPGDMVTGVPVLGGREALAGLYEKGIRLAANAVGGIGDIRVRIRVFELLAEAGFTCPALVHPTAYLDPSAVLAPGSQVFVHAYVGSEARIGTGCIINTGTIVSHDCHLGDYVNLSPGSVLAGEVEVGSQALVGMGVTINLGVSIGEGARIGNGATVKASVPAGGVVRAGTIWPAA